MRAPGAAGPPGVATVCPTVPPGAAMAAGPYQVPPGSRAAIFPGAGVARRALTHGELDALAATAAARLRGAGLGPGGLVALRNLGGASVLAYQLGCWQVGAAFLHADGALSRAQLVGALEGVCVVVASEGSAERLRRLPLVASTSLLVADEQLGEGAALSVALSDAAVAEAATSSDSESESESDCDAEEPAAAPGSAPAAESAAAAAAESSSSSESSDDDDAGAAAPQRQRKRSAAVAETAAPESKRQRATEAQPEPPVELPPLPASAAEAQAVVDRVREARLLDTEDRTDVPADVAAAITAAKKTMQAALSRLSSDLYTQECRWVLELLQNADDNEYHASTTGSSAAGSDAVVPQVDITVTKSHVSLTNNERGFTAADVQALCDIGASTKNVQGDAAAALRKRCIGEKGIGFKSVFAVSETPYVRSNYFSFRFEKGAAQGIGCLVPHWVEPARFPTPESALVKQPASLSQRETHQTTDRAYPGTSIVLPIQDGGKKMWETIAELDPLVVLFLRQLRVLTITRDPALDSAVNKRQRASTTREADSACAYRRLIQKDGALPDITIRDTGPTAAAKEQLRPFNVFQHVATVPEWVIAATPTKQQHSETEISCAFPLHADGSADAASVQNLFVFLPTRPYGLRFPLHAEFMLPSSREEVLRGGQWNQWLAEEAVPAAFIAAVQTVFTKPAPSAAAGPAVDLLRSTWYRFVPRRSDLSDRFFLPAYTKIVAKLKMIKCIATESSGFKRPNQTVLRTDPALENVLSNDVLKAALNLEYVSEGTDDGCQGETLRLLGCVKLSHKMLLKCLRHRVFVADMRARDDAWLRDLYAVLEKHSSSSKWLSVMQQIPLIRLADGSHCCALRDADAGAVHEGVADTRLIFLPSAALDSWMLSPSLNIVKATTISAYGEISATVASENDQAEDRDPRVRLLLRLGVCFPSPPYVIQRYIIPHHQRTRAPNSKISQVRPQAFPTLADSSWRVMCDSFSVKYGTGGCVDPLHPGLLHQSALRSACNFFSIAAGAQQQCGTAQLYWWRADGTPSGASERICGRLQPLCTERLHGS